MQRQMVIGRLLRSCTGGWWLHQRTGSCAKTLYNYVDLGLVGIKNFDLPGILRRNTPEEANERKEFGHWETDLVIGGNFGGDQVRLTLLERKQEIFLQYVCQINLLNRFSLPFKVIRTELAENFSKVLCTITTDNGSEFARLAEMENGTDTRVYVTHPYTSCEKGSIENHNGLIRRFIPKGKRISDFSNDVILAVELWANGLSRKILGYRIPDEAFDAEMDLLYTA